MELYKPYKYFFFLENYSNCYNSMWNNYLQHKRSNYDWFVILSSETYYINGNLEEVIDWLKNRKDEIATIENLAWTPKLQYQTPQFYYYYNIEGYKTIIRDYKDQKGVSIKTEDMNTNEILWKAWEKGLLAYVRSKIGIIFFFTNQGTVYNTEYNYSNNKWETTEMCDPWTKKNINFEDIKHIEKILDKMSKCKNFYDEDIKIVSDLLKI